MKLMLVDDETISNYILKRFLSQIDEKLEIMDFTDPFAAFDAIKTFDPFLIFMDLNMPRLSGQAFLDKMKTEQVPNKVVVITSSTSAFDIDRISGYPNVLHFLSKPVNRDLLRQILFPSGD